MKLHYKQLSEQGPPLLILHGLFGMLDNWQTVARVWANRYRVFLLDLRNHGKSPHSDEMDYYDMAADIASFLELHNLQNVNLLGHSMGGKVAMQFAAEFPQKTNALIVVDIVPKKYPVGEHENIFEALMAIDLDKIPSRSDAEFLLRRYLPDDEATVQFLLKNLSRHASDGSYVWKFNLPAIYLHYDNILDNPLTAKDRFDKPALFIKGGNSARYIEPEKDWPVILTHFPNAKLEIIANAGHWVHAAQPDLLANLVLHFLNQHN